MYLKVKHIEKILEEFAPLNLKESYDNVGLMVGDPECKVDSILVALDCTLDVIEEAKSKGCNFILTHHPLLFRKPSTITTKTLIGKKLINIIKNGINIYSSHTNLDSVEGGLNDIVMNLLELKNSKIIEKNINNNDGNKTSGIGRISVLDESISLGSLCEKVKKALGAPMLKYVGEDSMCVKKIAVVNGSGQDYFGKARRLGADCIITGDTTYHYASDLMEEKVAIIDAGHYSTEWPAVKVVAELLKNRIKFMGYDNKVLISEQSRCPYKFK